MLCAGCSHIPSPDQLNRGSNCWRQNLHLGKLWQSFQKHRPLSYREAHSRALQQIEMDDKCYLKWEEDRTEVMKSKKKPIKAEVPQAPSQALSVHTPPRPTSRERGLNIACVPQVPQRSKKIVYVRMIAEGQPSQESLDWPSNITVGCRSWIASGRKSTLLVKITLKYPGYPIILSHPNPFYRERCWRDMVIPKGIITLPVTIRVVQQCNDIYSPY